MLAGVRIPLGIKPGEFPAGYLWGLCEIFLEQILDPTWWGWGDGRRETSEGLPSVPCLCSSLAQG